MTAAPGLGARLRQARDLAGYSQHEIADVLGAAREVVSYWENDRRTPSAVQLTRLAEAYGVTTGSLLGTEPAPVATEEHELVYRGLRAQPARTKAGVRRWLGFLDEWADLLTECGEELPGRAAPPKREWRAAEAITDSRLVPRLAEDVRAHYELGSDAIPDLLAFLDQEGGLVYRAALDPIGDGMGISGAFYNHPRLGASILVNTNTTPGRQAFTLAHEFAHALFHYQLRGVVSRAGDPDRAERFADAFAAHFLVPGGALRKSVGQLPNGRVDSPFDVVVLHRHFRVSYATMLVRLRSEGLLSQQDYGAHQGYSPSRLAARLGFPLDEYHRPQDAPGTTLASYPASVLDRTAALVGDGQLTPAAAADLLQVSVEEVLGELLAVPEPAEATESREFAELPEPMPVRGRERTLRA